MDHLAPTVIALALLGFYGYCLYDFSRTPERDVRLYDRTTWVFLLLLTNVFGGALWLMRGSPRGPRSRRLP